MNKRAKDVTFGEILVTESGLMPVRSVASDMYAMTTLISNGEDKFLFGAWETVETLDD